MKFLDIGPEPIQLASYRRGDSGDIPKPGESWPPTTVQDFYGDTRSKCWPFYYSLFSVATPLAALSLAASTAAEIFGAPAGDAKPQFADACAVSAHAQALRTALDGAALHFAISHYGLVIAAVLAFWFAARAATNVLMIHLRAPGWQWMIWLALVSYLMALVGIGAYVCGRGVLAPFATPFFRGLETLSGLSGDYAGANCLDAARAFADRFDAAADVGVFGVALAAVALGLAAATLAWRFERKELSGRWADTYVLRHKLKALMTLFVFASVLLIASNIALSAYVDLGAVTLAEVRGATKAPDPAAGATENAADKSAAADPAAEYRKALLRVVGALSSATIVAMFLPAFIGLTSDIELAGKCYAAAEAPARDPPRYEFVAVEAKLALGAVVSGGLAAKRAGAANFVAGYEQVEAWKKRHGLALEFSDAATAVAAVAAPLLTSEVFSGLRSALGMG
ncbi:MAG: hypothetical protein ACLPN5_22140 [Roseiarcus sp.]